ncbi:MAG: sulfatase [Planctomycetota bacterium]
MQRILALLMVLVAWLVSGCGEEGAIRAVHLFEDCTWTVERAPGEVLGVAERELLRQVLRTDSPAEGPCVWMVDERIPWWRVECRGTSPKSPGVTIWKLRTEQPIDEGGLQRSSELALVTFPGHDLRRGTDPDALDENEFVVSPDGGFVALAGTDVLSTRGVHMTYPAKAVSVVGSLRGLLGAGGELPMQKPITLDFFDRDTRSAILLAPPQAIRTSVLLQPPAVLHLAFGIRWQGWEASAAGLRSCASESDGVGFRLTVRERGGVEEVVWETYLQREQADEYHTARVDLSPYAGQQLDLVFATFGSPPAPGGEERVRHDFAFLAEPILVTRGEVRPPRPNILFVLIDTLRADALGCYGAPADRTPALDRFAGEGVLFEQARASSSWTLPSHSSIFTSLLPSQHETFLLTDRLPERFVTLAEVLREEGWRTAAFTGAGYLLPAFGMAQGFDVFIARDVRVGEKAAEVLTWLEDNKAPSFVFFHNYEVHTPCNPPEPFRSRLVRPYSGSLPQEVLHAHVEQLWEQHQGGSIPAADLQYLKDLYAAEVAYVDQVMGDLFDTLKKNKEYWDNTLVIVASDHGEEFWEHGDHNHGGTLYEELLEVPLMMRFPGVFEGGRRVDVPVRLEDVAPTILEVAHVGPPSEWIGISLTNLSTPRDLFATIGYKWFDPNLFGTRAHAVYVENQKFVMAPPGFYRPNASISSELFDIKDDPGERQNRLKPEETSRYLRAVELLAERYIRLEVTREKAAPSGDTIQHLKDIGYIHGNR